MLTLIMVENMKGERETFNADALIKMAPIWQGSHSSGEWLGTRLVLVDNCMIDTPLSQEQLTDLIRGNPRREPPFPPRGRVDRKAGA